jgi:GTPase SAR1 family protein
MVSIKEDEDLEDEEYRNERFYSSVMEKPAKIVLIGDSGVGKSSLLYRIQRDIFHEQGQHTVGELQ